MTHRTGIDSVPSPQSLTLKRYYRATDDIGEVTPEFPSMGEPSRRDFLKMAGFSIAAAAAASCARAPIDKAIPYLNAPQDIVPGRAYWLASTCHGCPARCGVLVKCRDGRPIKLEGNPNHPFSKGGLCAVGQASVLGLYDSLRLKAPLADGKPSTWTAVDAAIAAKLANAKSVRVVTQTLASPTAGAAIAKFLARFPDGKHIVYDAISYSAILDAHLATHGVRALPRYRFDRANVILSIDADFLGTWISPVEFAHDWATRRSAKSMNWHTQLESRVSLTGSNADQRLRIAPQERGIVLAHLANALGHRFDEPLPPLPFQQRVLDRVVQRLRGADSLVVCGSQHVDDQKLTNLVNELLGNYGKTVLLTETSHQAEGSDAAIAALMGETPDAIFIDGNPVYELPHDVAALLKRTPLVVSFAERVDETARPAHFVCPDHHWLESWRDSEAVDGVVTMTQPAIAPLGGTRSMIESFAAWSGAPATAYDLVRAQWNGKLDWDKTLSDGFRSAAVLPPLSQPSFREKPTFKSGGKTAALQVVVYPSLALRDGRHAHNPWLQELPDPVTKITWDNVASLSPATAKRLNIKDGDVVRIGDVDLPAFVQPGQHDAVVAIALGYGRLGTDRFAKTGPKWLLRRTLLAPNEPVGRRVVHLAGKDVNVIKTGATHPIATTQLHGTIVGGDRPPVVEEVTIAELAALKPAAEEGNGLWPEHARGPHKWAMAIDLTRCDGCSACIIGCQAENNVPVVGKDEVLREREMHWLRVDRYYAGDDDAIEVVHQPMLCHHCENASCESVCPVLATVHSAEGLNQQVYNRCVGTRYCANNCAFKTRRFNWFDYPHDDRLANMALNPDVTVRSRGVMEKCSMCVQRIEAAKIEAKRLGVPIADGDIQTACQQSCPTRAIVFGDLNDPKSAISAARRDRLHYTLLDDLNLRPSVGYMKKVRNV